MDEPTAAISVRQVAEVLDLIRRLRDQNVAVILISHRMPTFSRCVTTYPVMRGARSSPTNRSSRLPGEVTGLITARSNRLTPRTAWVSRWKSRAKTGTQFIATWCAASRFWVTVALALICVVMSQCRTSFLPRTTFNVTRNFAFIGIIAMRHDRRHHHGGIDLSVGSVVGYPGMVHHGWCSAGYSLVAGNHRRPADRATLRLSTAS